MVNVGKYLKNSNSAGCLYLKIRTTLGKTVKLGLTRFNQFWWSSSSSDSGIELCEASDGVGFVQFEWMRVP